MPAEGVERLQLDLSPEEIKNAFTEISRSEIDS